MNELRKQWDVEFTTDLLDEYCMQEFGHDDWASSKDKDGNLVITFYKEKRYEDE